MGSSALAGGPGPPAGPSSRPRRRPFGSGGDVPRCPAAVALLLVALLAPAPAWAGPITTLVKGLSIEGAQATFNNSWGQSVMATGTTFAAGGEDTIQPFATGSEERPTSAPATFLHAVVDLRPNEAKASATAVAGYSNRAGREDGEGNTPGINAFNGGPNGLSALGLEASPEPQLEKMGGQVDGRNIGTESLSVFGRVDEIPARQTTVTSWF